MRLQPLVHIGERCRHKAIDTPEQVLLRDAFIEPKLIEQARLIAAPPLSRCCPVYRNKQTSL
jgi:hypothetical protein